MPVSKLLEWRKPKRLTLEEYFAKLKEKGLNEDGSPVLDPTPMAPPIGYKKQPSMVDIIRDMVQSENLRREAMAAGAETFEESEDFDVGDDPEQLRSPYENDFDPPVSELVQAAREIEEKQKAQLQEAGAHPTAAKKAKGAPKTEPGEGGAEPPTEAL